MLMRSSIIIKLNYVLEGISMNRLNVSDRAKILSCLVEGNSMRSTSRLCDVSINTITKLLIDVGFACLFYHQQAVQNLNCKRIECDEFWGFCEMK